MTRQLGTVLLRLGAVLFALGVVARLAPTSGADRVVDDLALVASGAVIVVSLVYLRATRRRELKGH